MKILVLDKDNIIHHSLPYRKKLPNLREYYTGRSTFISSVDLKYALHLPIDYPNLHPEKLCDFRRQFFRDQASQGLLQALFRRLEEVGLWGYEESQSSSLTAILEAVCKHSRI